VTAMWQEFWTRADSRRCSDRTILAGDFNQKDRESPAQKWSRRRWRFCFDGKPTTANGHALDEIALDWTPKTCRPDVIPTFSDHHLVVVEVDL